MDIRSKKTGVFMGSMVNAGDEVSRLLNGTISKWALQCTIFRAFMYTGCLIDVKSNQI